MKRLPNLAAAVGGLAALATCCTGAAACTRDDPVAGPSDAMCLPTNDGRAASLGDPGTDLATTRVTGTQTKACPVGRVGSLDEALAAADLHDGIDFTVPGDPTSAMYSIVGSRHVGGALVGVVRRYALAHVPSKVSGLSKFALSVVSVQGGKVHVEFTDVLPNRKLTFPQASALGEPLRGHGLTALGVFAKSSTRWVVGQSVNVGVPGYRYDWVRAYSPAGTLVWSTTAEQSGLFSRMLAFAATPAGLYLGGVGGHMIDDSGATLWGAPVPEQHCLATNEAYMAPKHPGFRRVKAATYAYDHIFAIGEGCLLRYRLDGTLASSTALPVLPSKGCYEQHFAISPQGSHVLAMVSGCENRDTIAFLKFDPSGGLIGTPRPVPVAWLGLQPPWLHFRLPVGGPGSFLLVDPESPVDVGVRFAPDGNVVAARRLLGLDKSGFELWRRNEMPVLPLVMDAFPDGSTLGLDLVYGDFRKIDAWGHVACGQIPEDCQGVRPEHCIGFDHCQTYRCCKPAGLALPESATCSDAGGRCTGGVCKPPT